MSTSQSQAHPVRSLRLKDFRSPGKADERRREPRSPVRRRISIERLNGTETSDVRLVDCSTHGLGFIAPYEMEVGEQFVARLDFRGLTLVFYTVRHCRRIDEQHWIVGAEFSGYTGTPEDHDGTALLKALTGQA